MANDKTTWSFTPSTSFYTARILVQAESIEDARGLLINFGYTESEMTEDYNLSDYADCFELKNVNDFCGVNHAPATCTVITADGVRFIFDNADVTKEQFIDHTHDDWYHDYSEFFQKLSLTTHP